MQGVANSFTFPGALKLIITFNFAGLIIIALSFFSQPNQILLGFYKP